MKPEEKRMKSEEKLITLLSNWMNKKVQLRFHLRGETTIEGILLYYTRYEYVVQPGEEKPAVLIHKHAVDFIERKK